MTKGKTDFKRMIFKENKVWLSIDQDGKPIVKNGKVLIKYQLNQDYEYWVREQSIKPLEALNLVKKKKGENASKKRKKESKSKDRFKDNISCQDAICIYTDGASSGNPGPSGIGVFLRFRNDEKQISRYIGVATNNIAELKAIRAGLLELKTTDIPVRVFTDSRYAYGLLALGWKARKNLDLVKSVKETMLKFKDLKLIKVKGHAGVKWNEKADFLATLAIKKHKR